jgi:hypothetical protein
MPVWQWILIVGIVVVVGVVIGAALAANRRKKIDHPTVVNNYRAAHDIYLSQQKGDVGTEAQRQAFVHYRALFDKLLETNKETTESQEATA